MFSGERINVTEQPAVLHVALRAPRGTRILVDGQDVVPGVHAVLRPHGRLLHPRAHRGLDRLHGKAIRNVVNIGIGGSDLGPVMASELLRHYSDRRLTLRFRLQRRRHRPRRGHPRPGSNALIRRYRRLRDGA